MGQFNYVARAVDGKSKDQSGLINANSEQDAEKQVKALFPHQVNVIIFEVLPEEHNFDLDKFSSETDLQPGYTNIYYHESPEKKA